MILDWARSREIIPSPFSNVDRHTMVTQEQIASFHDVGYLRLSGAFPADQAAAMRAVVWRELAEVHGIEQTDPDTWRLERAIKMQGIKRHPVFAPIGGPVTCAAIDALMGAENWQPPGQWGGFHIAFPVPGQEFFVPKKSWHVDFHYSHPPEPLFGLTAFSFLADVEPRGGATLVVSRSHRVVRAFVAGKSMAEREQFAAMRKELAHFDPWLMGLLGPGEPDPARAQAWLSESSVVADVEVRVTELTARAGEVILMHPWLLHTVAPNCRDQPRMMRAKSIYRQ